MLDSVTCTLGEFLKMARQKGISLREIVKDRMNWSGTSQLAGLTKSCSRAGYERFFMQPLAGRLPMTFAHSV
jgi:hypothetical protein